jgi:hypothetical protein
VKALRLTKARVATDARSRKHPLPHPLAAGIGVLCRQRIRHLDAAVASAQVAGVNVAHLPQVRLQRLLDRARQHCHTILVALPFAHDNLVASELNILHTQP